jgi:hypothetical protein
VKKLLLVAVLALALAPGAGAKEITGLEVCGVDGCRAVSVPNGLHEWPGGATGGATFPPPAAPFVEVRLQIDRFHTEQLWYVPSQRIFASRSAGDLIRWSLAGTDDLRAGRPISSEGRSFDWPLVSGALLLALALGLTALLLARRSRRPRAATA